MGWLGQRGLPHGTGAVYKTPSARTVFDTLPSGCQLKAGSEKPNLLSA
jgi:hypothetical protein